MVSEDFEGKDNSVSKRILNDERKLGIRRLATGTYVVYALIILIQGLILSCPFIKANVLVFASVLLIPASFTIIILLIAFARQDRGAIALLASLHLGLGALILSGLAYFVWEESGQNRHNLLFLLIIFGNLNIVVPLAALVMYFVEVKAPMHEKAQCDRVK